MSTADTSDQNSRDCHSSGAPAPECPWFIQSPEHHNCLWVYIKDKSAPDGSIPELLQSEIAALLGWSNTKTYFALKQAMVELVEALNATRAKQLVSGESESFPHIDIDPLISVDFDPEE